MKKFWSDFKAFIAKGNVVDLAVAVIIGGAFNKIVSSLVNDVIMPLISLVVGGADVTEWKWVIKPAELDANGTVLVAETALKYGVFIQTIIDFLIIALTVFLIVKIFKASKEKLNELGEAVIKETKKLKKKRKKGQVEEINETEAEIISKVEEPTPAPVPEPQPETKTSTDEEMVSLLKEIRDSLKPTNKKK